MSARRRLRAPDGATYSRAVVIEAGDARWIYVAGQTPLEPVPEELREQAECCFAQIEAILAECGAVLGDVVQITAYLTDLTHYSDFAEVRGNVFGVEPPSSAAVGVAALLGDARVEISAVAIVQS